MQKISILVAMKSEADSIIERLQLHKVHPVFRPGIPFEVYQGTLKSLQLSLITGGTDPDHHVENVATVPAALMTYLAIEKFEPDLLLNTGTAGGIGGCGCEIGDVYLSDGRFCFHDRRIPLPGFDQYGLGLYPSWNTTDIARDLKLKTGTVSTGNSLDLLDEDLRIIQENQAIIKDMEATAIAWVCRTLSVPMFAVKAITDLLDKDTPPQTQFVQNFHLACTNLGIKTVEVLRYLAKN